MKEMENPSADMAELDIRPSSTIVICGKRNEGKSVLAKWLLYNLVQQAKVDIVYLFSTTEHLSHSFDCVPKEFVIPTFDIPFMEKIISSQEKEIMKTADGKDDPSIKQILFIFDDMLGSVKQGSNEQLALNRLFATSRHCKNSVMVISQTTKGLFSPALRQNTDYLFFRKINDNQLPSLFESVYWPGTYKSFVQFYHRSTASSKFGFLAYDNLTRDDQKFFLITAEQPEFNITYCAKNKKGVKDAV
jgi:hypothetical protein